MKRFVNIVVPIAIIAAGIVGFKIFGQKPEVPKDKSGPKEVAAEVLTARVSQYDQPLMVEVDGEAVTYRVVAIGAEVEGRVVKKTAAARGGTYIHKGDLLFEIDSTRYQLEVDRLTALQQQAREEISGVVVDLDNTTELISLADEDWKLQRKNLIRMQGLLDSGTANEREVEEAQKQELLARNSLQTLRNQKNTLTQQKKTKQAAEALVAAQLQRAEFDVARCVVKSTLEGRIVADEVEEGDFVKTGDVLTHVSDGSKMEIKCQLRGEELAWVWQQKQHDSKSDDVQRDPLNLPPVPCEVAFEFENVNSIWDGYIARLEGSGIDRDTRTFPCRVLVDEPRNVRVDDTGGNARVTIPGLLSGMYVNVRIPVMSPVPLLKLPLEAVRPGGQIWVKQNERLAVRFVSLAHVEGESAFVRQSDSGLSPGDSVIVSPLASVKDGMKVVESVDDAAPSGATKNLEKASESNQKADNAQASE